MKKFVLFVLALIAGGTVAYHKATSEAQPYLDKAKQVGMLVKSNIVTNPVPIGLAIGTFLFTCIYHKVKGKSFRDAVEFAATRVVVVPAPQVEPEPANPILMRAYARTTRTQLLADQVIMKTRINKLPSDVTQAEKEFCFAEKAVYDAKRILGEKHKVRNVAHRKLTDLRAELTSGQAEVDAIENELGKLAEVV